MKNRTIRKHNLILLMLVGILFGMLVLSGCSLKKGTCTVTFNTCTSLNTTKVNTHTVEPGSTINKPNLTIIDDEYSDYVVVGWYLDEGYTEEWDFEKDVVEEDMVLYAKWEEQLFVRYFTSNSTEPRLGEYVKKGDYIEPKTDYVKGYKVLGYYADPGYSIKFDFTQPITESTNVYTLVSDCIYWDATAIVNDFNLGVASGEGSTKGTVTLEENEQGQYANIDFGYSTTADPHLQYVDYLDMTKSQVMTIKYKNLGNAKSLRFFWQIVIEDGSVLGLEGDITPVPTAAVEIKSGMSESDDWQTVEIDMTELTVINGVSHWSEGWYLSIFRIDAEYKEGMDDEFVPNIIQIQEISFATAEGYVSRDTVELKSADVFAVLDAAKTQNSVTNGYVFPKNRASALPRQGAIQYNQLDCVTWLFPYGGKKGIVTFDMSPLNIQMDDNQMLCMKYKNEGYGDTITLRYTNTDGRVGEKEVVVNSDMSGYSTLYVNMLNEKKWGGELVTLDLIYHKQGADNVFSMQQISVQPYVASDIPGINFADPKCAGFTTNDAYEIVFDSKGEAVYVEMKEETATFQKKVSVNTTIYDTLDFKYQIQKAGIKSITIGYQLGGKWYTQDFDKIKRTSGIEHLSLPLEKKGNVTALKIQLHGKGTISMSALEFKVNKESSLDFSNATYISNHFMDEWAVDTVLDYDSLKSALYMSGAKPNSRCFFYIGASGYADNILLDTKNEKIYVCYSNPGEAREISMTVFYAGSDNKKGSGVAGDDATARDTGDYLISRIEFFHVTVNVDGTTCIDTKYRVGSTIDLSGYENTSKGKVMSIMVNGVSTQEKKLAVIEDMDIVVRNRSDLCVVIFQDEGTVYYVKEYVIGTKNLNIPDAPDKDGYDDSWEDFKLVNGVVTVNAVHVKKSNAKPIVELTSEDYGGDYVTTQENNNAGSTSPQTGDGTTWTVWVLLCMLSAAICFFMTRRRRKSM